MTSSMPTLVSWPLPWPCFLLIILVNGITITQHVLPLSATHSWRVGTVSCSPMYISLVISMLQIPMEVQRDEKGWREGKNRGERDIKRIKVCHLHARSK